MKTGSVIGAVCGAIFRVVVVVFAVFLIYRGATACYDYGYRIFTEPAISSGEGRTVTVAVTPEMSPSDIGNLFVTKGLVRDAKLFTLQYYLSEYRKDMKPGIFDLSTAMTAEDMMAVMAQDAEEKDAEPAGTEADGTVADDTAADGAGADGDAGTDDLTQDTTE